MNSRSPGFHGRGTATALIAAVSLLLFPAAAPAQSVTVHVGGQALYLNPGPIERNGRVFVPLRGIFERLGSTVVYQSGTINATKGQTTVTLRIGSTQALVDNQPQILDVAPFIVGATTYVPLRFVAQSLGAQVNYNGDTRLVAIIPVGGGGGGGGYYPPAPRPPYPPPYPPGNPAQLRAQQPYPGATTENRFATISAEFTRQVRANTVRVWLDGNGITSRCNISSIGFSYRPPAPLEFGSHSVRVEGADVNGLTFNRSWSFSVSGAPGPELRNQQPAPDSKTPDRFTVISADFSRPVDTGSVRILLDGNNITSRGGLSSTGFSYKPPAPLDFGDHKVRVTGRGQGGNAFDRSWTFVVIRTMPTAPNMPLTINQPAPNSSVGRTFLIQGNTGGNAQVTVTAGATPSSTGQFSGSTTAGPQGNFKINVTLTTLMGQSSVTVKITATDPVSNQVKQTVLQLRLNQ